MTNYIVKSGQQRITLHLIICRAVADHRLLLEHERMEQEIRRRKRELTILNAIAQIVSQPLDLQQMLGEALRKTLELMAAGGGMPVDLLQHASRTRWAYVG
jgi:hypothetical protein